MTKLKPRTSNSPTVFVETERREITTMDVTYHAMSMDLLKKYFPSIYKEAQVELKKRGGK